ncbi:MAG TPA: TonB family protein [Kofleriaceae bacterium]
MRNARWFSIATLVMTGSIALADAQDGLDRSAISAGISSIKPKVVACGEKAPGVKGKVKVKVVVAPAGNVTSATVAETPDEALGKCVASVVKDAKFGATKNGGTFSYPFVF